MSKKSKLSLWDMFKHSPTIRPILEKVLPTRLLKPKVCEHNRVDYKSLSKLAQKQMEVLAVLSEQVLLMEKEKEVIRKACCKELDKLKAENIQLKHRLEVIRHAH